MSFLQETLEERIVRRYSLPTSSLHKQVNVNEMSYTQETLKERIARQCSTRYVTEGSCYFKDASLVAKSPIMQPKLAIEVRKLLKENRRRTLKQKRKSLLDQQKNSNVAVVKPVSVENQNFLAVPDLPRKKTPTPPIIHKKSQNLIPKFKQLQNSKQLPEFLTTNSRKITTLGVETKSITLSESGNHISKHLWTQCGRDRLKALNAQQTIDSREYSEDPFAEEPVKSCEEKEIKYATPSNEISKNSIKKVRIMSTMSRSSSSITCRERLRTVSFSKEKSFSEVDLAKDSKASDFKETGILNWSPKRSSDPLPPKTEDFQRKLTITSRTSSNTLRRRLNRNSTFTYGSSMYGSPYSKSCSLKRNDSHVSQKSTTSNLNTGKYAIKGVPNATNKKETHVAVALANIFARIHLLRPDAVGNLTHNPVFHKNARWTRPKNRFRTSHGKRSENSSSKEINSNNLGGSEDLDLTSSELGQDDNDKAIAKYNKQHMLISVLQRRLIILSIAIFGLSIAASILAIMDIELTHKYWKKYVLLYPESLDLEIYRIYNAAHCTGQSQFIGNVVKIPSELQLAIGSTNKNNSFHNNQFHKTEIPKIVINSLVKILISIISILTLILLAIYHKSHVVLYMKTGVFATSTIFIFKRCTFALIECILMSLHIPVLFECHIGPEYQLIVMIRLIQITKLLKQNSRIQQRVVSKMLGGLASLQKISTLRVYLLSHPWYCLIGAYVFSTFCVGYITFVIERAVTEYQDPRSLEYHSYLNNLWMMFVTITSLGFGDVVPKSNLGKLLVTFVSISGVILAGVFISTTQQFLQIPDKEKRLFETMKLTQLCKDRIVSAARTIQLGWRYYKLKKRLRMTKLAIANGPSSMDKLDKFERVDETHSNGLPVNNENNHPNQDRKMPGSAREKIKSFTSNISRNSMEKQNEIDSRHGSDSTFRLSVRSKTSELNDETSQSPEKNKQENAKSAAFIPFLRGGVTELEVLVILQHHRFQRALVDFIKAKNAYRSYQINSNDTYNIVLNVESKMTSMEKNIEELGSKIIMMSDLLTETYNKEESMKEDIQRVLTPVDLGVVGNRTASERLQAAVSRN